LLSLKLVATPKVDDEIYSTGYSLVLKKKNEFFPIEGEAEFYTFLERQLAGLSFDNWKKMAEKSAEEVTEMCISEQEKLENTTFKILEGAEERICSKVFKLLVLQKIKYDFYRKISNKTHIKNKAEEFIKDIKFITLDKISDIDQSELLPSQIEQIWGIIARQKARIAFLNIVCNNFLKNKEDEIHNLIYINIKEIIEEPIKNNYFLNTLITDRLKKIKSALNQSVDHKLSTELEEWIKLAYEIKYYE
jgi:hypothetical protein